MSVYSTPAYSIEDFVADLKVITAAETDDRAILSQVTPLAARLAGRQKLGHARLL